MARGTMIGHTRRASRDRLTVALAERNAIALTIRLTYGELVEGPERAGLPALRAGQRVLVEGRAATIVYPHPGGEAVVVRYDGEPDNRVVGLRKLQLLPDTPEAA